MFPFVPYAPVADIPFAPYEALGRLYHQVDSLLLGFDPIFKRNDNNNNDDSNISNNSDKCRFGQAECHGGCMPDKATCCEPGTGYCRAGTRCDNGTCCVDGRACDSSSTTCGVDGALCKLNYCMPAGSICCADGTYCGPREMCGQDGFCRDRDVEDGGDDDNSSGRCSVDQEECGEGCMPKNSTCCGNGQGHCQPGWRCDGVLGEICSPEDSGSSSLEASNLPTPSGDTDNASSSSPSSSSIPLSTLPPTPSGPKSTDVSTTTITASTTTHTSDPSDSSKAPINSMHHVFAAVMTTLSVAIAVALAMSLGEEP